jgi:hypothetical protein
VLPDLNRSSIVKSLQKRAAVTFIAVFAAAAPALAQDMGPIREMDANGDGTITKVEAQSALEARFRRMDTNHDGKLSEDEYVNAGLARLAEFDTDKDGNITRSELRKSLRAQFFGR